MKRSGPPARKTPLKRTPIQRNKGGAAWLTAKPESQRKRKKSKTPRAKMKAESVKLFSLIVRSRGRCELQMAKTCKPTGPFQTAHIVRRRYERVAYDESNALCSCFSCHVAAHNDDLRFKLRVVELIGAEELARIEYEALFAPKVDYEAVVERLRERAEALGIET